MKTKQTDIDPHDNGRTVRSVMGRPVTPGKCSVCGCDDDWSVDGRGTIYCSCQCCAECQTFDGHAPGCSELRPEEQT